MTILVLLISLLVILTNSWHVLTSWFINVPNTLFTGIAHYYGDYFLYTNFIAQGARGTWIFTNHLFTNESLSPTWIYWLYTILGKLSFIGVSPFMAYNGAIIICSGILLWLIWNLVTHIFPSKPVSQIAAFLFVTTASNFAHITNLKLPLVGDFWFSPTPALNRLGGVPHQIFQTILLLSVIYISLIRPIRPMSLIVLAILSFLAATANPIQMLLIVVSTCFVFIFSFIQARGGGRFRRIVTALAALALPALLGALLVNTEFSHQPVLTAAKMWEDSQHVSVTFFQFLQALGPIGLLLPFGLIRFFKHLTPLRLTIGIFGILSVVLFLSPLPTLLSTTPVRWISPASYIFLPLLAVEGLTVLSQFLHRLSKKSISRTFWFACFLCLYMLCTIPSIITQIYARTIPLTTDPMLSTLSHIPNPVIEALQQLRTSSLTNQRSNQVTKYAPVVLTDPALPYDVIVPTFTGLKSFTGHPIHTLYPDTKEALRQTFFSQQMNPNEAQQFIRDHAITYIITQSLNTQILQYTFLTKFYENPTLTIYSTQL